MDWNCHPTCIGSLPHRDPAKAVDLILQRLRAIPYWPQLSNLGFQENMYAQFASHLPGIKVDAARKRITVDLTDLDPESFYTAVVSDDLDHFAPTEANFHGLYELLRRDLPKDILAVKGHVTGPVSMGLQIFDAAGKSVVYDETYSEIVRKNQNMMLRWQEKRLREKCSRTIMFLDEPSLSLIGTPFAAISSQSVISWINEVFEGAEGFKGVHCCGNTDWPMVLEADIDIVSFDAYNYGHTIALYPEAVSAFLERGGSLAWGIVPNGEEGLQSETDESLVGRLEQLMLALANKGIDLDLLKRTSLITPQCGLGPLDEPLAEKALFLLSQVSQRFRESNGLEGK